MADEEDVIGAKMTGPRHSALEGPPRREEPVDKHPTGLRAADPDAVENTLRRLAELGLHFTVTTGRSPDPGWRSVQSLYDDRRLLDSLVERVRTRIGARESRVAASILFQAHAARLWSVSLGALVQDGLIPDLDPDTLLWRDQEGSVRLHLERTEGWQGERVEDLLLSDVVIDHLAPMVAAVPRLWPLSDRLLWGNAASALLGTARMLDGAAAGPARRVADRLLARPPLRETIEERRDGEHRRRSCCLYYRVPGGGFCGDCVLPRSAAVSSSDKAGEDT